MMTDRMRETIAKVRRECRFPVKQTLTEMVGYDDWCIYRDPAIGLYALNPWTQEEVNLLYWNITLNAPKLDWCIRDIRVQITEFIEEEAERYGEDEDETNDGFWEVIA